jgi:hypothetical protein
LYGISSDARRIVKFNLFDKSLIEIGSDFGEGGDKLSWGVRANTGSIYCAPDRRSNHILKINTKYKNNPTIPV